MRYSVDCPQCHLTLSRFCFENFRFISQNVHTDATLLQAHQCLEVNAAIFLGEFKCCDLSKRDLVFLRFKRFEQAFG